jgi:RNA recognition motif-containing protein
MRFFFCLSLTAPQCIAMKDRETGRARGFGFVTFSTGEEAQNAISNMHDRELDGRSLRVNPAVSFLFLFPFSFSSSFCF